ncbi:hypothetical protein JCM9279_000200 [Rhodotorula babjevae]
MTRNLPVELIEHILADDSLDHADLARCCRVSRSVFARARPRLYAAKEYLLDEDGEMTRRTQAWCEAIQASRAAAALVRRLRLTSGCEFDFLPERRSIEAVVQRCRNLEHISTPDEPLDKIFDLHLLIGANLRSLLTVNFSADAYELLLRLPNLKHLGLVLDIRKLTAYPRPGDRPPPAFRLESLSLDVDIHNLDTAWARTLGATLANSCASIRSFKYTGSKNDLVAIDKFPALDTLCIGLCDDDDIVKILGGSRRIKSLSIEQHQRLFPNPLGTSICHRALRALPPSVRAYHVLQFPTVDDLGNLLATLPDDVHLDELGVSPGTYRLEPACPRFTIRTWTEQWHAQKAQWGVLEAACAAQGIKLVLARDLFFPAEAGAPNEPGSGGQR